MIVTLQPPGDCRGTRNPPAWPAVAHEAPGYAQRPVIFHVGDARGFERSDHLRGRGYQVRTFRSLAAADAALRDCELLLAPAGELTVEALKQIQRSGHSPRVIALHEHGAEEAGLLALERGADDAFPSYGSHRELLARVRALLRRPRRPPPPDEPGRRGLARALKDGAGPFRILRLSGVRLSQREFELLAALVRRPGRVCSRGELMDVLRAAADVHDRSVDSAVHRLRRKFAEASLRDPIVTHRSVGYALRVELLDDWLGSPGKLRDAG